MNFNMETKLQMKIEHGIKKPLRNIFISNY